MQRGLRNQLASINVMKLQRFWAAMVAIFVVSTLTQGATWSWESTYYYPLSSPPPGESRLWWTNFLSGPKFDESVWGAPLLKVEISAWAEFDVTVMAENVDSYACRLTFDYVGKVSVMDPNFTRSFTETSVGTERSFDAAAYDGTLDYGGTSGVTYPNIRLTNSSYFSSETQEDLDIFRGSGTISLPAVATDELYVTGSGNVDYESDTYAGVKVRVTYTYVPEPTIWGAVFTVLLGCFAPFRRKFRRQIEFDPPTA